jgi:hypothetical protein
MQRQAERIAGRTGKEIEASVHPFNYGLNERPFASSEKGRLYLYLLLVAHLSVDSPSFELHSQTFESHSPSFELHSPSFESDSPSFESKIAQ